MIINIDNIMNSLGYVFFDFCGKNGFCVWLVFAYGRPALSEGRAKCVARLKGLSACPGLYVQTVQTSVQTGPFSAARSISIVNACRASCKPRGAV